MTFQNRCTTYSGELHLDKPSATLCLTATGVGRWDWQPDDGTMRCCARCRSICGLPANEPVTFETLLARIHPEDRDQVALTLQRALGDGRMCSIECRTLEGGRDRWVGIDGRRCSISNATPSIVGIVMDITARKERAFQRELLVRDLSHRVSNAFAVLSAVVHLSGRSATTAEDLIRVLQARISALARAYTIPADDTDIALRAIVERELAPFSNLARVAVSGEPTWLAPRFAISMTLILHELATNAMKHGALRRPDGELFVRWWSRANDPGRCTVLHWKEHSSELITPPTRTGVGSSLLSMIARNVEGHVCIEFQPDGLAATIVFPCERAQHPP
jgi:two-component sensor histidine kinase